MGKNKKNNKISKKRYGIKRNVNFLEKRYKGEIKYSCFECLKIAYNSEKNDTNGYVMMKN